MKWLTIYGILIYNFLDLSVVSRNVKTPLKSGNIKVYTIEREA
jgi:hypothetical protein